MRIRVTVAAGAAALAGCASVPPERPMSAAAAEALAGREISLATREKPPFVTLTAGQVMGGAIFQALSGAPSTKQIWDRLEQSNVADPAERIAGDLAGAIAAKFGARVAAANGASDLVLDVRTMHWGFNYFLSDPSKYRIRYQARTRLLDARNGQVLAEGHCEAPRATDVGGAPTYGELMDSGAARLKSELARAADFCAAQFASKMFSFDLAQYRVARPALAQRSESRVEAPSKPSAGLPAAGTIWSYRAQDRTFKRARDFSVQLAVTAGSSVTETFSSGTEHQTYSSNSRDINFTVRTVDRQPLYELAPYLLTHFPEPSAPLADRPSYPAEGATAQWRVRITEVQRESVQVPAGRFEAVRLRVTGENPSLLHGVSTAHPAQLASRDYRTQRFEYTVWYAPESGRYVQSHHRMYNRLGNLIGDEMVQLSAIERPQARR